MAQPCVIGDVIQVFTCMYLYGNKRYIHTLDTSNQYPQKDYEILFLHVHKWTMSAAISAQK